MRETSFLNRVLIKLGLKKHIDYNSVEYLRSRGVQIGENVSILNSLIDFGHGFLISIGNDVTLTGVRVLAHDASTQIPLGVSKVGRVIIGDKVFVGQGSIILPNTRIGSRVIVGAGSVVSRDIPDNSVAAGNPARVIGSYDDFVERHRRQMETRPVYHTLWSEKTEEEKEQMRKDLEDGIGYDL
ncbi:MAG TPA: acyltransferase [Candidatus Intestinimonas stercoravium]|nr:acyltransferase [Candidatus Intestinimonas stercoravium]